MNIDISQNKTISERTESRYHIPTPLDAVRNLITLSHEPA